MPEETNIPTSNPYLDLAKTIQPIAVPNQPVDRIEGLEGIVTRGDYDANIIDVTKTINFNDIYAYTGPRNGFARKYPTFTPGANNMAIAAANQSTWDYVGNSAAQFFKLWGSSFAGYFANTAANIGKIGSGNLDNFFDSELTNFAADVATNVQWENPIYQTLEEQEYSQNNIGLGASIAKYIPFAGPDWGRNTARLFGQLGFTAGTISGALVEEVAIAAATAEVGGAGAVANAPRAIYKVWRTLTQAAKNLDRISDIANTAGLANKLGKTGISLLREANRATGESRMEALMASESFKVKELERLEADGTPITAELLSKIEEQSKKVGNATFNFNMPVLMASNMVMLNNLFKGPQLSAGKLASEGSKIISQGSKWVTKRELINNVFVKYGQDGLRLLGKSAKTSLPEGFEELAQGIGSRTAEQYYSLQNSDIGKSNLNFIKGLGTELSRSFESGEGWDEFVSGALIGFGIGLKGNIRDVRAENASTKLTADQLNDTKNNVLWSINNKNFNEQTVMANESTVRLADGRIKSVKDIRNEAMVGFFKVIRRSGKDKQGIQDMIDQVRVMQTENPEAIGDVLGGKTLEQYQSELNTEYDRYTKLTNAAENLFYKELKAGNKLAQDVTEFVKDEYVTALMGSADAVGRLNNLGKDLNELFKGSDNASKISELTNNIFDSDKLSNSIAQVSSSIATTEDFLKNVELTKEERSAKQKELAESKKHLNNLQSVHDALYSEKASYQPETVAKTIIDAITDYDPNISRSELDVIVNDMVAIESSNQELLQFANYLQNPQFRQKYYNAAKEAFKKSKDRLYQVSEEEVVSTTPLTEEEIANIDDALAGVDIDIVEAATEELNSITNQDGVIEYDGNTYPTVKAAQKAAIDKVAKGQSEQVQQALIEKAKQATQTEVKKPKERVTQAEYDKFKETNEIPSEVSQKLSGLDNPTPQEQEMIASLQESKKEETNTKNTEKELTPKTKEDVRKQPLGMGMGGSKGILVHYYNVAVGRVYEAVSTAMKNLGNKSLTKAIKKVPNARITTINLNDNLIKDNVHPEATITADIINNDITAKGFSVIKDKKGRLIIVTNGTANAARTLIAKPVSKGGLGLYISKAADTGFTEVRAGNSKGVVLSSSFGENIFGDKNAQEVNKLRKGDRIQVVVPANEFNQKQLDDFYKAPNMKIAEAFKALQDNLIIELHSNGVVVGIMRAGDYYAEGSNMEGKVAEFRSKIITTSNFLSFGSKNVVVGSIGVSKLVSTHKVNINESEEMVFTSLADYEKSQKKNKNITVTYFIADSTETAKDKNGKVISRTGIGRSSFFVPNAIYVSVKDSKTGDEVLVQAVADEALTFTEEDLQNDDFKKTLSVNLQPSETPLISKRVAVDEETYSTSKEETKSKQSIRPQIETALEGGNALTINMGGIKLPLTDVVVDYDTQTITGNDPNGKSVTTSFINISSVEAPIVTTTTTATSTTATDIEAKKAELESRKKLYGWEASYKLAEIAKAEGVDLSKLSREEYANYAINNYLKIDDSQLRANPKHRNATTVQEVGAMIKADRATLTQLTKDAFDSFYKAMMVAAEKPQIERYLAASVRLLSGTKDSNSWLFFSINNGINYDENVTHKSYFSLKNLNDFSPEIFKNFMIELQKRGYNGGVKIFQDLEIQGPSLGDQIVMHGYSETDAKLALQVAKEFYGDKMQEASYGKDDIVDGKSKSYSQILSDRIKKEVDAKKVDEDLVALETTSTNIEAKKADIERDAQGNFIPKKYTLNRKGENPAPNISASAIKDESFAGDKLTGIKQVKLLEIRGSNSNGVTVGRVWIQLETGETFELEVLFNDAELAVLETTSTNIETQRAEINKRKPLEKGLERIDKILGNNKQIETEKQAIEVLNEVHRFRKNHKRSGLATKEELTQMGKFEQEAKDKFGLEIVSHLGKKYEERLKIDVVNFNTVENSQGDEMLIIAEDRPTITKDGVLTQRARVNVLQGLSKQQYDAEIAALETTTTNIEAQNESSVSQNSEKSQETEIEVVEELSELSVTQTEEWIKENGEDGQTYILEDGTKIEVLSKSNGITLLLKGGNFKIRINKDGTEESLDIDQLQAEEISEEMLFNIWNSQKETLSLRDEMILELYPDEIAKFQESLSTTVKDFQEGYDKYLPIGLKNALSFFGILPNEFLLRLSLKNWELVNSGKEVKTLYQLMTEAGISESVIETIQDNMSFGSYVALFNLVTTGTIAKSSSKRLAVGQQLMMDFGDDLAMDAIEVETTSDNNEEEFEEVSNKFIDAFGKFMGKQGLLIKGFNKAKELASAELKAIATAVKKFTMLDNDAPGYKFLEAFLTLNTSLRQYGLEINLESLVKVEAGSPLEVGVQFVTINDTKNFLKEFDDVQMNEENQARIKEGKSTIFVKKDDGGLFELPIKEINTRQTDEEINDTVYLNDILQPLGYTADGIFVTASHIVNGNATEMISRSMRKAENETRESDEDYKIDRLPISNGVSQEEYFNRNKAQNKVKEKTC